MSQRTIIEINHDFWRDLEEDPEAMERILKLIQNSYSRDDRSPPVSGVRVLGTRHHSETLKLEIR